MGRIQSKRARALGSGAPEHRGGVARRGLLFVAGLVAGLAAGPLLSGGSDVREERPGALAGPAVAAAATRPLAPVEAGPAPEAAPEPGTTGLLADWLAMAERARLESLARKVTGAGLDLVAEGVIARLEEDSLKSLIASTTDFSAQELEEIEDVPGFALDLARIAMEGTVREASEPDEDVRPIDFATEVSWDHRAVFPQSQFSAEDPRIFAVFESEGLGLGQTLAKWTRVDDGEILLFQRLPIRAAAASSYVYLDAPPEGWAPGEYRVDVYSADTSLRWLASGQHRITR